jgi:hypothetical protein
LTMKAQTRKAIHVTAFLSEKAKRRRQHRKRELVLRSGGENMDRVVIQTDDEHPYAGIYMEEWGAANRRVMNHLLAGNILKREDVDSIWPTQQQISNSRRNMNGRRFWISISITENCRQSINSPLALSRPSWSYSFSHQNAAWGRPSRMCHQQPLVQNSQLPGQPRPTNVAS